MLTTSRPCRQCQTSFVVTEEDLAFLKEIAPKIGGQTFDIPPPTLCPRCREIRRCAQWNEIYLYKRKCDLTGKDIISDIHPDAPYKVYDQEVWYSDKWDPMEYGRDFDFSKPFFEQYFELCKDVPHMNLFTGYQYDENCDYTNYAGKNKNCYLIFDSDENRDCYYSYSLNGCKDCLDSFRVRQSELCYWCVDCLRCYSSSFLQDCTNCTNSMFLKNCTGCTNCLMCSNLVNKEYMVENRQVSKEEFEQFMQSLRSLSAIESSWARFEDFKLKFPQKYMHGVQNENVTGDYIVNSKNARLCFDCTELWDCAHFYRSFMPAKTCMDCEACGAVERLYECSVIGYNGNNLLFSCNCLDQHSDYLYSSFCSHSAHLFGCNGLRRKKYCILNKQYTKEEYEKLVPKIIEHMRHDGAAMNRSPSMPLGINSATGSWGEFFPITLSPFAYNESTAQDYYPLSKEEVIANGWQWRERDEKEFQPQEHAVPDAIDDVTDEILKQTLACAHCSRNYKIIPQELAFYRKQGLPIPNHCFYCRHASRKNARNPRKLWKRECQKCRKGIETTYAPERPEIVYCEECYLKEVY